MSAPETLDARQLGQALARAQSRQGQELLLMDDVALTDESELKALVAVVEGFIEVKEGVRLSFLTGEQWLDALSRSLSPALRRGAERHIHVLRDKADPHHLLVSPSAVAGVNEGSRVIYAEVVYHVLRCAPTPLSLPLRRGLDDLLAQWVSERTRIDIFTRNFPDESDLVLSLLEVLARQFGYEPIDWGKLLRRDPDKFFYALERSKFAGHWVACARQEPAVWSQAEDSAKKRPALVALLRDEALTTSSPIFSLTRACLRDYLVHAVADDALADTRADTPAGAPTSAPEGEDG